MLGKIWGLVLFLLGLYVAFEVSRNPALFDDTRNSQHPKVENSDSTAKDSSPNEADSNLQAIGSAPEPKYILAPKTHEEITEQLIEICDEMQAEMKASKIPSYFSELKLQFREKRLETAFLKKQLAQCFRQSENSKNVAELEIFSSDFAGENAAHQIQLQVSVFQRGNNDKLFEVARKFELAKKNPSLSTRAQK